VLELRVGSGKAVTPFLCANHPSEFFFFDETHYEYKKSKDGKETKGKAIPKKRWAFDTMMQDLIAARWQAYMAEHWDADPMKALADAKAYWESNHKRVEEIVAAQELEFGLAKDSPAIRNPDRGVLPTRDNTEEEPTAPTRKPNVRR
jgi:hypothetical protein